MRKTKLAIVDDHILFREGIKRTVSSEAGILVVMEAGSGKDFINQLGLLPLGLTPDIVFLDSRMPEMDGVETVNWIRAEVPQIRIIMFSMFDHFELVLEMLKLGVNGYISKGSDPSEIFTAIDMVMERGFYYSAFIAEKVIESMRNKKISFIPDDPTGEMKRIAESLTKTEKVFLKHVCSGMRYGDIAKKMFLSPRTVDVHRANVLKKFNVNSTVNMVLLAVKNGIVDLD
jgi:DNA-binding NarL/FixJ family response regulator